MTTCRQRLFVTNGADGPFSCLKFYLVEENINKNNNKNKNNIKLINKIKIIKYENNKNKNGGSSGGDDEYQKLIMNPFLEGVFYPYSAHSSSQINGNNGEFTNKDDPSFKKLLLRYRKAKYVPMGNGPYVHSEDGLLDSINSPSGLLTVYNPLVVQGNASISGNLTVSYDISCSSLSCDNIATPSIVASDITTSGNVTCSSCSGNTIEANSCDISTIVSSSINCDTLTCDEVHADNVDASEVNVTSLTVLSLVNNLTNAIGQLGSVNVDNTLVGPYPSSMPTFIRLYTGTSDSLSLGFLPYHIMFVAPTSSQTATQTYELTINNMSSNLGTASYVPEGNASGIYYPSTRRIYINVLYSSNFTCDIKLKIIFNDGENVRFSSNGDPDSDYLYLGVTNSYCTVDLFSYSSMYDFSVDASNRSVPIPFGSGIGAPTLFTRLDDLSGFTPTWSVPYVVLGITNK